MNATEVERLERKLEEVRDELAQARKKAECPFEVGDFIRQKEGGWNSDVRIVTSTAPFLYSQLTERSRREGSPEFSAQGNWRADGFELDPRFQKEDGK